MKNKFFTDKFVLTPKFAGVGNMEDYDEHKKKSNKDRTVCSSDLSGGDHAGSVLLDGDFFTEAE